MMARFSTIFALLLLAISGVAHADPCGLDGSREAQLYETLNASFRYHYSAAQHSLAGRDTDPLIGDALRDSVTKFIKTPSEKSRQEALDAVTTLFNTLKPMTKQGEDTFADQLFEFVADLKQAIDACKANEG